LVLTCCWPDASVPDPSTVVPLPTASSANPKTVPTEARTGPGERRTQGRAHGHAEISPRPRPSDSSGAWNPSFHAICPRLSAAWRRSQGNTGSSPHTTNHVCSTGCTASRDPAAWPFQALPGWPGWGHRAHVWILPSIAASMATALSRARKSSRTWSGESGFGPRALAGRKE
jgi:hypothetical protein